MTNFCDLYKVENQKTCLLKSKCEKQNCDVFCLECYKFYYYVYSSKLPTEYVKLGIDAQGINIELNRFRSNMGEMVNKGINLLLCGKNPGTGKTFWAVKLMQNYFCSIINEPLIENCGIFLPEVELMDFVEKTRFDKTAINLIHDVMTCKLLVIDDIGMFDKTNYQTQELFRIIDYRMRNKNSIIYTSNLVTSTDFEKVVGGRLSSRILDTSMLIEFKGESRRNVSL